MNKFFGVLGLSSLLLGLPVQADILRVAAGVNHWQQDVSGLVQDGADSLTLRDTLGHGDDSGLSGYVILEHPLPLLPNVKLQRTELKSSAAAMIDTSVVFDGQVYAAGSRVASELDLSHTDATFYYELLDNIVSLDLGLTLRKFDGGVALSSGGVSSGEAFDDVVPLLYLGARVDLPFTGFYVAADVNALSVGDTRLADAEIALGWDIAMGLGVKLGYRSLDMDYEDSASEKIDITVDGLFVGASLDF